MKNKELEYQNRNEPFQSNHPSRGTKIDFIEWSIYEIHDN
jgi:hypothetical protein